VILVIDNYDSFTHNLVQLVGSLGGAPHVVRNDALDVGELVALEPSALIFSPGPGRPEAAGVSVEAVRTLIGRVPILGVCLGHQCLASAFGGEIVPSPSPMHGKTSLVHHDGTGLFAGMPSPFEAARYHSLAIAAASLPERFHVSARAEDGTIMGMHDGRAACFGVQFHPESFLSPAGRHLVSNFLSLVSAFA